MKTLIINEKEIRKRMIDLEIKTINELALKSGVSKPTIYDYLNGKTPLSVAFIRLCDFLDLNPNDILIEADKPTEDTHV
ncbi:helix-turn-helix domain-containing protein [Lachnospiraceae bacterium WCA-9-b2]|jgi:transcriptional regulator with XRE-family HTH domain|uniref:Helix-turn-helix domain-containing protein n=1 Tax=Sporofaciens musculi TaxID=2681861 RepID=A0A7X3MFH7_9FIRM|nr:helix-turn-helix transcriptional regulator [Sporofaciens musculi]MCI8362962.1 helix-turn-helix transcriptional regulator [Clostridia bacterium]MXP75469.1 helix-turn-helix domain-containing protein [Sporofaciens musculi]